MPPYMYTEKQPCGTPAAYRRHIYRGEQPCRPCLAANAAATMKYRAKPRRKRKASEPAGWQPSMAVDVMALLDICEAIEGPDPEWYRERAEADGAA